MGLLNRLWSQADFWDKEENKRQAQQVAPKPQPARAPRPVQNQTQGFGGSSFESSSGGFRQPRVKPMAMTGFKPNMSMPKLNQSDAFSQVRVNKPQPQPSLLDRQPEKMDWKKAGTMDKAMAGVVRSIQGTGQAVSGLYDLATPGKGTNRVSNFLDREAKKVDRSVAQSPKSNTPYKAGQVVGDVLTGGAIAKGAGKIATKYAPSAITKASTAITAKVATKTAPLASKGVGGRIMANTVKNVASPKYQAVNAGWSAMQMGKEASAGHKITPARVGTDLAIGGVAFPAGGAVLGEGARGIRNIVTKGTNIHPLHRDQWGYNKDAVVGAFKGDTRKRQSSRALKELQDKKLQGSYATADGLDVSMSTAMNKKITSTGAQAPNSAFSIKQRIAPRINSVIGESKYSHSLPDSGNHGIAPQGFDYYDTPITYRGKPHEVGLMIGKNDVTKRNTLYETIIDGNYKKSAPTGERILPVYRADNANTIPNNKRNVNVPERRVLNPNIAPESSTPRTPQEHPSITKLVKEYAQHLKSLDDGASVSVLPDGRRVTEHSPFYRTYFKENKRKPSMVAWEDEARLQLESGTAGFGFDEGYKQVVADANNPELQSLLNQKQPKTLTPFEQNQQNAKDLRREVLDYRDPLTPVKKTGGESNIPVRKVTQQGDVVTKTNVNPSI